MLNMTKAKLLKEGERIFMDMHPVPSLSKCLTLEEYYQQSERYTSQMALWIERLLYYHEIIKEIYGD